MAILLALSVTCAILAYLADRFSYEACHRGLPLAFLVVALPAIGTVSALASLFHRTGMALLSVKLAAVAINVYQGVAAVLVLTGIGIVACG